MSTLVERLTAAAAEAIANEAPELARDPNRLRGVMLELKISQRGGSAPYVSEGTCYIERRAHLPKGEVLSCRR